MNPLFDRPAVETPDEVRVRFVPLRIQAEDFRSSQSGSAQISGTPIPRSLASVIIANSFSGTLGNLGDGSFTIHWPSRP
jgi:hypothetical protein